MLSWLGEPTPEFIDGEEVWSPEAVEQFAGSSQERHVAVLDDASARTSRELEIESHKGLSQD
jgi:hypothetical protein